MSHVFTLSRSIYTTETIQNIRLSVNLVTKAHIFNQINSLNLSQDSDRPSCNFVITIAIRLRSDYDPTTRTYRARLLPFDAIRREQKRTCQFFVVVVSQLNRMHIVISITFVAVECIVVSSYRSCIVVESQLWYRLKIQTENAAHSPEWTACWGGRG